MAKLRCHSLANLIARNALWIISSFCQRVRDVRVGITGITRGVLKDICD